MTDISQLGTTSDTASVTLYHPVTGEDLVDDNGQKMFVEVYGQDSKHYRDVDRSINNKNILMAQKSRKASLTAEKMEAQQLDRTVKCVKSWHLVIGGETPECNEANVRDILSKYSWIREQVEEGIYDRSLFLGS